LGEGWVELRAIEGGIVLEHAVEGVQQFAHDGDESDHFAFSVVLQVLIEGFEVRVMASRSERRHKECATDMAVTDFTDAHFFVNRGTGLMLSRVQAGVSDPLSYMAVGGRQRQLAQQLQCADRTNARRALQKEEPALKLCVLRG
jgi:hypothetical protein